MAKQTNKITVLDLGAKPTNHLVSIQDLDNGTIPRMTHVALHVMVLTRRLKQRKYLGNSHSIRKSDDQMKSGLLERCSCAIQILKVNINLPIFRWSLKHITIENVSVRGRKKKQSV